VLKKGAEIKSKETDCSIRVFDSCSNSENFWIKKFKIVLSKKKWCSWNDFLLFRNLCAFLDL